MGDQLGADSLIFIRHSQRPGMFVISPLLLIGEATHNLQVVLRIIEADLMKAGKPTSTNKLRKFIFCHISCNQCKFGCTFDKLA